MIFYNCRSYSFLFNYFISKPNLNFKHIDQIFRRVRLTELKDHRKPRGAAPIVKGRWTLVAHKACTLWCIHILTNVPCLQKDIVQDVCVRSSVRYCVDWGLFTVKSWAEGKNQHVAPAYVHIWLCCRVGDCWKGGKTDQGSLGEVYLVYLSFERSVFYCKQLSLS